MKSLKIKSIKKLSEKQKNYCITVKDNHNLFVGNSHLMAKNCDDANNAADGESKAILETTAIWWKEVMSTRKNDPQKSARVMVAQRLSELDASQIFLDSSNPVHLCLPMEYEGKKSRTILGWEDPRTEEGQLLWPDRFPKHYVDKLKKELGSYATAGQLQQRPTPRGGGIIKKAWLKSYKLVRNIHSHIVAPKFSFIFQSFDTAFKEGEENDFSVCLTFGIADNGFYLINRWKDKVDFPELEKVTIELANIYIPNEIIIEDKASGQSLIQSIRKRTRLPIKAIKVERDKVARAYAISPIVEAGRLFLPENEPWVQDYIDNLTKFPGALHDDDVDATTQGLIEYGINKMKRESPHNSRNMMAR